MSLGIVWPVTIAHVKTARGKGDKSFSIAGRPESLHQHETVTLVARLNSVVSNEAQTKHKLDIDDEGGRCVAECFEDEHSLTLLQQLEGQYVRIHARLSGWRRDGTVSLDVKAIRPVESTYEVFYHTIEVLVAVLHASGEIEGFQCDPKPVAASRDTSIISEDTNIMLRAVEKRAAERAIQEAAAREDAERRTQQATSPERHASSSATTKSLLSTRTKAVTDIKMLNDSENTLSEQEDAESVVDISSDDEVNVDVEQSPTRPSTFAKGKPAIWATAQAQSTSQHKYPTFISKRAMGYSSEDDVPISSPEPTPKKKASSQHPLSEAGPSRARPRNESPTKASTSVNAAVQYSPVGPQLASSKAARGQVLAPTSKQQRDPYAHWAPAKRKMILQICSIQDTSAYGVHFNTLVGKGHDLCHIGECRQCAFDWLLDEGYIFETVDGHYELNDEVDAPRPL